MRSVIFNLFFKVIPLLIALIFTTPAASQGWTRIVTLPETEFTCIKVIGGKIYTASENRLYTSTDGLTWQMEVITNDFITPTSLEVFNNTLHLGTFFNGVYQKILTPNASWSQSLNGMAISSFTIHNGELYLSTFGAGVFKKINTTWQNINYNLPTFSYNVSKVVSVNNILYAFAGGNGTFYSFNPSQLSWNVQYYFGGLAPGFIADDVLKTTTNTVFVTRGNALLRSDDFTQTWNTDAVGLLNGNNRLIYQGIQSTYVLSLLFNDDNGINYTHLQKRANNAPISTSWGTANELLEFYTYGITELGNKVYLATERGLFVKTNQSLGGFNPIAEKADITIFPIPANEKINFDSSLNVKEVLLYDVTGRVVYQNAFNTPTGAIFFSKKGNYIAHFVLENGLQHEAKIIIN